MSEPEQKYRITYTVIPHPEGISKSEVREQGLGGCDCLLIASILGQPGGPGGLDVQFASLNGFRGHGVSLIQCRSSTSSACLHTTLQKSYLLVVDPKRSAKKLLSK